MISAKRMELVRKYIGNPVQKFAVLKEQYNHFKTMYGKPSYGKQSFGESFKTFNENSLVEKSLELIEVALLLDDRKAAQEIRKGPGRSRCTSNSATPCQRETPSTVALAADEKPASPPAANAEPEAAKIKIIEGVGWGDVRVGATKRRGHQSASAATEAAIKRETEAGPRFHFHPNESLG